MAAVTLLHLGILAYLSMPGKARPLEDAGALTSQMPSRQAWHLRLLQTTAPTAQAAVEALATLATERAKPQASEAFPPPSDALYTGAPNEVTVVETTLTQAVPAEESVYWPRSALSKAPWAFASITIPFPDGLVGHGRYSATLTLYIDENGTVRKVEAYGPELPPVLEEAARLAFLRASFSPGEREGRRVKARIMVEVIFDDTEATIIKQALSDALPAPV